MPLRVGDERFLPQLDRYRRSGVDVVTLNVAWDGVADTALEMLHAVRAWIADRPEGYFLVESVDDLDRAFADDRLGVTFDIEGGSALGGHLSRLATFHDLGVRWIAIAYNRRNALGAGCLDDEDDGLTPFGREVVARMAELGVICCCTHTGARTARDVLDMSERPVIFSHSNAAEVWAHPRNISDELIRACAATGGVVGLNGIGDFLGAENDLVENFVRHANHVADLVGPEHVGLGMDFVFDLGELAEFMAADPGYLPAVVGDAADFAMIEPERLPEIVASLSKDGWSEGEIVGLLGGNLRRVARAVWR